jgi:hypothetical protein
MEDLVRAKDKGTKKARRRGSPLRTTFFIVDTSSYLPHEYSLIRLIGLKIIVFLIGNLQTSGRETLRDICKRAKAGAFQLPTLWEC